MAHDILGNQFAATESAWHRLGIIDATIARAIDAVDRAGMNWHIHKLPVQFTMPDGSVIQDSSAFSLWREPVAGSTEWARLSGMVSADYDFWQNTDVADHIDQLIDRTGWKFATAGILANGARMFVTLDMGNHTIAGEDYSRWFSYIEERDGKTRSWAIVGDTRIVCANTCSIALRGANGKIGIRHDATYKGTAAWAMDIVSDAQKQGTSVSAALNRLAQIAMDDDRLTVMLDAIAPAPAMPVILTMPNLTGNMREKQERAEAQYNRAMDMTGKIREKVIANYNGLNDTMPSALRGTAMAAFQAVTEYTTHQYGTLGARGRKATMASRAESDLLGAGLDMRNAAYTALTDDF